MYVNMTSGHLSELTFGDDSAFVFFNEKFAYFNLVVVLGMRENTNVKTMDCIHTVGSSSSSSSRSSE